MRYAQYPAGFCGSALMKAHGGLPWAFSLGASNGFPCHACGSKASDGAFSEAGIHFLTCPHLESAAAANGTDLEPESALRFQEYPLNNPKEMPR
jgi:hypothetical protein